MNAGHYKLDPMFVERKVLVTQLCLQIWSGGMQALLASPKGLVHTCDLDLAISPSDAISIEIFPSLQIAIAGDSDNM